MKLKMMAFVISWWFVAGLQEAAAQAASAAARPDAETSNDAVSSTNMTTVSVQGSKARAGNGLISDLIVPKSASIISDVFIKDQAPASNPFQLLALTPGVTSNGRGPSGLDRGAISVRGFQSNQLGVSLDGVPVNDAGTFNTFPQEYVDTENLSKIFILQGAGDADSPNIGATGGVIGMIVKKPAEAFGVTASQSGGSDSFRRSYVRLDSGTFAGNNRAFLSYSNSAVNLWRGDGRSNRQHVDGMLVHDIDADNHLSLNLFYNKQMSANYQALTQAQIGQYGYGFNFAPSFAPLPAGINGTAQTDNNSAALGSNTLLQRSNFHGLQFNPFEDIVVSSKANLKLANDVHLDIQPYFWFGRGNGGSTAYVAESNTSLLGAPTDLNGDGDTRDTRLLLNPFQQQQFRPGVISRLKWDLPGHELVFGLHYERSRLHEWRSYEAVDPVTGRVADLWLDSGNELLNASGQPVRNQDQVTTSTTIRPFFQDTAHFLDDQLIATFGLQYPIVKRTGENQLPLALRTSGGLVAPSRVDIKQHKLMPSLGAVYSLTAQQSVFASVAQTFRATDNAPLYQPGANLGGIKPEAAVDSEIGYRYSGSMLIGSATAYHINYMNRQQSLFDVTVNNTVSKNIGDVEIKGIELEMGTKPVAGFSLYSAATFNTSELKNDILVGVSGQASNRVLPTRGKKLTDLPDSTLSAQLRYEQPGYFASVQAKYTGKRYATLMNDEAAAAFTTVDLSAGVDLPPAWIGGAKADLLFTVNNLFDKQYLGAINFGNNAQAVNGIPASGATYFQGGPRFASLSLRVKF